MGDNLNANKIDYSSSLNTASSSSHLNHNSSDPLSIKLIHATTPLSSVDNCDMTSLEILSRCHLEIFPKRDTCYDDETCRAVGDMLPTLNGEYIQFIGPSGKLNDETFAITNFRIFLLMHKNTSFINVPLMLIESIEIRENFYIYVYLKNAKTIRFVVFDDLQK